jgi:hypothetical protein
MSQADAILERFPGPVRVTPSRGKWVLILLIGIGFTAIGADFIHAGDSRGWLAAVFVLCIPIAIIMLLPGAGGLVLDGDGFAVTSLYRTHWWRWTDTGGFAVATLPPWGQKMVVYDARTSPPSRLARYSTKLTGRNSGLPENYGLKPEVLAELMSRWRERALRSSAA